LCEFFFASRALIDPQRHEFHVRAMKVYRDCSGHIPSNLEKPRQQGRTGGDGSSLDGEGDCSLCT